MFNRESDHHGFAAAERSGIMAATEVRYDRPSCERLGTLQPPQPTVFDIEIDRLRQAARDQDALIYDLERFADRLAGCAPEEGANGKDGCVEGTSSTLHRLNILASEADHRCTRMNRLLNRLAPLA